MHRMETNKEKFEPEKQNPARQRELYGPGNLQEVSRHG